MTHGAVGSLTGNVILSNMKDANLSELSRSTALVLKIKGNFSYDDEKGY